MPSSHSTRYRLLMACGRRVGTTQRANILNRLRVEWLRANEVRRGADRRSVAFVKLPLSLAEACAAAASFPHQTGVYILRLRTGQLYIGSTTELRQRLMDHSSGQACQTTTLDPPATLLRFEAFYSFAQARQREAQLKRWSRAKKAALVRGDAEELRRLSKSRDDD